MRLVSAVLGFVLRKAGLLAALVLSMFLGYLLVQSLVPAVREAVTEQQRLERVAAERAALEGELEDLREQAAADETSALALVEERVVAQVEDGRREVAEREAQVERLRDEQAEICGTLEKLASYVLPGDACDAAEEAVEQADAALDTFEATVAEAEQDVAVLRDTTLTPAEKLDRLGEGGELSVVEGQIDTLSSDLDQKRAEEQSLEETQGSGVGWVVAQWSRSWRWLLALALLVLLAPPLVRTASYFVLMPLVHRVHRPVRLADGAEAPTAALTSTGSQRTLAVELGEGEVLSVRSEHVRPVQGHVRSRLLYDWSSPFISFAAGLYGLSRVTGDGACTRAVLSTPDDPDSYLMRLDLTDHPGVVVHPRHVVGVIGHPELTTRWRWGIAALATWQVRYIMFAGTGGLVVQGSGDVVRTSPEDRAMRMEQTLLMGFDSRLEKGIDRTEVFWPYLWGRTPLVDEEFTGPHPFFWQKSTSEGPTSPLARVFDAFFSGLGKILGF